MSHVISSSSDEDIPVPVRKRQRKSKEDAKARAKESPRPEKEDSSLVGHGYALEMTRRANAILEAQGKPGGFYIQTFCGQRVEKDANGEIQFIKQDPPSAPPLPMDPALKAQLMEPLIQAAVDMRPTKANEHQWQLGMEMALKILTAYQVDHKELTLLPDSGTLECFKKAAQAYLVNTKTVVTYNFTTQKSFQHMVGRILLDFVIKAAGVAPGLNPSGCVVWQHGCQRQLHCLHGSPMIQKEQLIEMDVNSENAQRVLKENPEKTKIVTNRWGRNVVQMKNEDAYCCFMDVNISGGNFSSSSCGMSYTDGPKALMAFQQIMAFQRACYPQMSTAESHLLMPLKCECNWNNSLPMLGRQTCKMTPYALSSTADIDRSLVQDAKMLATLDHPAMLVFQCCNPVYRNSKAAPQKNCDFKISTVDMVACVQIAKKIWSTCIGTPPPLKFPEFKWSQEYKYQTTILPQGQEDNDVSLF
ncbi:single stranded DNA-binding protein [bat adenovirus 3]|uniref:DNA-binding protein n=1 Tax=bat adenovirus 3 TaxID=2758098 RepID=D3X7C4_9ADEN|nr:single stranded DNA-binding protein [bat adenovirus 3]ADD17113.1 single stranded DNA-binding protein [bat adenovirus 3]